LSLIFGQVECTIENAFNLFIEIIESILNYTLHLSKNQTQDGHKIGPKHVVGIIM
jgi:hypothetical protein